jgi:hypothetical protein
VAAATVTGPEAHRKEVRPTLFHLCFFLSTALFFILLSVLVPGMSTRFRHQCWLTAAVAFYSASVIARRHPVVFAVFAWLSHQPTVLFSQYKSATSNQPTVFQPVRLGCNRLGWSSGWQPATTAINQPHQRHQPISNSNSREQVPFFQILASNPLAFSCN